MSDTLDDLIDCYKNTQLLKFENDGKAIISRENLKTLLAIAYEKGTDWGIQFCRDGGDWL